MNSTHEDRMRDRERKQAAADESRQWPTPDDLQQAVDELADDAAERAAAWDKAREDVREEKAHLAATMSGYHVPPAVRHRVERLLATLNELERMEDGQ